MSHEFTLTYDEFLKVCALGEARCHYCTAALVWTKFNVKKHGTAYNLDRMNNALGYTSANVTPCCKRCNWSKAACYSYEEWWAMTEPFSSLW
jgi:hypothetical protein